MMAADEERGEARLLKGLNRLAIDLAAASLDTDPVPLALDRLRTLTGALVVSYSEYDAGSRAMRLRHTSAERAVLTRLNDLLGRVLGDMVMPVSDTRYQEMVGETFVRVPELYTLALGAIPRPLARTLETVFGVGEKIVLIFQRGGRLFGTASLLMPASEPRLPDVILEIFSSLVSAAVARHQAELAQARAEAAAYDAQRLESIGRLAGGVAHDFNNLLTAIIGNLELASEDVGATHPAQERLHDALDAANTAAALTTQLLAFGRKQVILPRVLDLNQVVETASRLLARTIGENVELTLSLAPAAWPVRVDPMQFQQVIVNLATNARDAMPGGGRLTIETANVALDDAAARNREGASPGRFVRLSVGDTGEGIAQGVLPHVFEPFYTTKEMGKGTGLGLATVYGAVRQNGGIIDVESAVGRGTTVTIHLPAEG